MKVVFTKEFEKSFKRMVWRERTRFFRPSFYIDGTKYFIQRGKRGYSDRDVWNVDAHLKDTIPPMLRKLAKDGIGYPAKSFEETSDEEHENQAQSWKQSLLDAADDIEAYTKHEDMPLPKTKKAKDKYFKDSEEAYKRTQRGMHFVAENFHSLWD